MVSMVKGYFVIFLGNFEWFSDFSSYLCSQSTMTRKGYGVIIFKKVLKNDEALPSVMDSRAFFAFKPTMEPP